MVCRQKEVEGMSTQRLGGKWAEKVEDMQTEENETVGTEESKYQRSKKGLLTVKEKAVQTLMRKEGKVIYLQETYPFSITDRFREEHFECLLRELAPLCL